MQYDVYLKNSEEIALGHDFILNQEDHELCIIFYQKRFNMMCT